MNYANIPFFSLVETFLRRGTKVKIRVRGASMRPFLKEGDTVLIVPVLPETIGCGDIVLTHTAFGVVLHRILFIRKGEIWLSGDANCRQLEYTTPKLIIGRADKAWRNGQPVKINSRRMRALAFGWYLLYPFRRYLLDYRNAF